MFKKIFTLSLLMLLSSCAKPKRTYYGPLNDRGGYQDKKLDENLYLSRFSANANTHHTYARAFSVFRAIEICRSKGYEIAYIYSSVNNAKKETIKKSYTSTYNSPSYYNGTSSYNSYDNSVSHSGTISGGGSSSNTKYWNETLVFPEVDTIYSCENDSYILGTVVRPISRDLISHISNDFLNGLEVTKLTESSPNKDSIYKGDVILSANNIRVTNIFELLQALRPQKGGLVELKIIRQGKLMKQTSKVLNITLSIMQENENIMLSVCKEKEFKNNSLCTEL